MSAEEDKASLGSGTLRALSARRFRIALLLTGAVMLAYFGFILLVAFAPERLGAIVAPGLSLGILVGALVIVFAWLSTWFYVRWMNRHYDDALERLRD
ncbi:MAG: DUF485 domain-containing protein [Myxococcota bacterium]